MGKSTKIEANMEFISLQSFLQRYKTQILYGAALLVIALVALTQYVKSSETGSVQTKNQLQRALTQLQMAKKEEVEPLLLQINALFQSDPSLKVLFGGQVAEALLLKGETTLLQPYSAPLQKRLEKEGLRDFYAFNQTSLLLGEGKTAEALQIAKEQKSSFTNELLAYTLLRIAFLENSVASWQEFVASGDTNPSVKQLLTSMKVGPVTLEQFSHHRIQELQLETPSLPRS